MWCGQDIFFWVWADFFTVVLTICQHCWANGFFGSLSFLLTNKYACLLACFERVSNALGARRRVSTPRRPSRDSNDVEFTRDIVKSFADRCKSRLTFKMSKATLSKHFARRKCRFFTLTKRVSRRTMNLSIPNDSRDFCVLICCSDRVSRTLSRF